MIVLCVDDNEVDALLLSRMLEHAKPSARVVHAETFKQARQCLAEEKPAVILLDLSLPDAKGLATVQRMRAIATGIPIVVLTGSSDESMGVKCVQSGAQDYLVKGKIDEVLLLRVIMHAIERQRIEEELLMHRERLQGLVYERTVELSEARDAALESARLKSEFISTMSHEIRTPLNAFVGMTELLLATELTPTQRNYAKVAQGAGEALLRIIQDILDFAKIESGNTTLQKEKLNVPAVVDAVEKMFAHQAAAKGIALSIATQPGLPDSLEGDGGRLRQVLLNVMGNAVKFTTKGEIELRATSHSETADSLVVEFRISDTGIGISEENKKKLFHPFSQADASVARIFGGTGLGLAISKNLVERMGGQMGVESKEGVGSTFWFTIPFVKSTEGVPVDLPQTPHNSTPSAAKVRILVADDNEFNRILAQEQLLKLGYEADTVADGTQALRALALGIYPLVLMDCRMPGVDGYQATAELRQREAGSAVRTIVIAMTANVLPADQARGIAAGMDDYLMKPVKMENLSSVLARWLKKESPVNLETLRTATHGNPNALIRLQEAFLKQSTELLGQLSQAIETNAGKEIERLAHCLAGSSVCFGALPMAHALRQIEHHATHGQQLELPALFKNVLQEFERVKEVIA